MPYLTPDEVPEGTACRPLFIPNDTAWLSLVSGILTEGTKVWNWEKFGTLTPQECADVIQLIVDGYYNDACGDCVQPGGEQVPQLDELGRWRVLDGEEWVEPSGDYAIPPQTARTEPTALERRCLAAKNAVNVLAELYEQTTDAFEAGIGQAVWLFELGLAIGVAIAGPIGLLARAAMSIAVFAFQEFFRFSDFLTEDFWTEEFDQELYCILFEHSTDTAGVVSFDFNAVYDAIFNNQTFDLVAQQFRLAAQVMYLLRIIGQEGLNLAGETTAITDPDCDDCQEGWCYEFDFTIDEQGWAPFDAPYGEYIAGVGWRSEVVGGTAPTLLVGVPFPEMNSLRTVTIEYTQTGGAPDCARRMFYHNGSFQAITGVQVSADGNNLITNVLQDTTTVDLPNFYFNWNASIPGVYTLHKVTFYGDFDPNPFGDDNCEPL